MWTRIDAEVATVRVGESRPLAGQQLLVGYQNAAGAGAARVLDLTGAKPKAVGALAVCPGEMVLAGGDFDGDATNGGEVAGVCTGSDRSITFKFQSRDGAGGAAGRVFGTTLHSPQSAVIRSLDPDRDDLLVVAAGVDARPQAVLISGSGVVLLELPLLSAGVR